MTEEKNWLRKRLEVGDLFIEVTLLIETPRGMWVLPQPKKCSFLSGKGVQNDPPTYFGSQSKIHHWAKLLLTEESMCRDLSGILKQTHPPFIMRMGFSWRFSSVIKAN